MKYVKLTSTQILSYQTHYQLIRKNSENSYSLNLRFFEIFFEIYFSKIFRKKIDIVKILKIAQGPKFYDRYNGFLM